MKRKAAQPSKARKPLRRRTSSSSSSWPSVCSPSSVAAPPPKPPAFVEVPDLLVNLSGAPGERVQYLKLKIVLELKEEKQIEAIKPTMPRITDIFQTYVRELRSSDLNGSAGVFRLKEELTKRVNAAVAPVQVSAVLFKEVVIQ